MPSDDLRYKAGTTATGCGFMPRGSVVPRVAGRLLLLSLVPTLVLLTLACKDIITPGQPRVITPEQPLEITPAQQTLQVPRTLQLSTHGGPDTGTVSWETSDQAVASVSASGLVTATFPGSVTITARRGGSSATLALPVTAARIDVAPRAVSVKVNGTQPLTATVRDADGASLSGVPVRWSTGDTRTATVDARSGVVTGKATGTTTIYADGGGASGGVTVTVTPPQTFAGLVFSLVDIGVSHTCGLEAPTGLAYCWGDNHAGALGAGELDGSEFPVPVSGARRFSSLSAGLYATCGLEAQTGFAYCWGANEFGELGDGTTATLWVPTLVAGGRIRFSAISAGWSLTCGVEAQTDLGYCWGKGGLTGDGTRSQRSTPTLIGNGNLRFNSITVGDVGDYDESVHACGIEAQTGLAYCWGQNNFGQVGDGTTADRLVPMLVGGGSRRFSTIDAGLRLTCGIEAQTGLAYCWGQNNLGQVGDGTTAHRLLPTLVDGGSRQFTSVHAGELTCGIEAQSSVGYCWGRNNPLPTVVGDGSLRFSSINAAYRFACGVEAQTGRGYCWDDTRPEPTLLSP